MTTRMRMSRIMLLSVLRLLRSSIRRQLLMQLPRVRGDFYCRGPKEMELSLQDGEHHFVHAQPQGPSAELRRHELARRLEKIGGKHDLRDRAHAAAARDVIPDGLEGL